MDLNNETNRNAARQLYNRLRSTGYSDESARTLAAVHVQLVDLASQLEKCDFAQYSGDKPLNICMGTNVEEPGDILNDGELLPSLRKFVTALSSVPCSGQGYIALGLVQMQLRRDAADMFLQAFKTAPIQQLILMKNGLDSDGFRFVVDSLKAITTLEGLVLDGNPIDSDVDVASLMKAAIEHTNLTGLFVNECCIGLDNTVMKTIIPNIGTLSDVTLQGNSIGSFGAKLIAECIASNPAMRVLFLQNNLLNDSDAKMIAKSLKTNTNLRRLNLTGNEFTPAGYSSLELALFDHSLGMESVYNSNNSCHVADIEGVSECNKYADPKVNRRVKMLMALALYNEGSELINIDDIPLNVMPRVLLFIHAHYTVESWGLSQMFLLMRQWNMPLLFANLSKQTNRKRKYGKALAE